jgi:hypothetical protein
MTHTRKFRIDMGINEFVLTFEVGIKGWILVQRGLTFPFATQVSQWRPELQLLSTTHVCPSWS